MLNSVEHEKKFYNLGVRCMGLMKASDIVTRATGYGAEGRQTIASSNPGFAIR